MVGAGSVHSDAIAKAFYTLHAETVLRAYRIASLMTQLRYLNCAQSAAAAAVTG